MRDIQLEKRLLTVVKNSSCYGLMYDGSTPECQKCDLVFQCKELTFEERDSENSILKGLAKEAKKEKGTKKSKKKSGRSKKVTHSKDMPDFSQMNFDELTKLARANKVEWTDYGNDNITRMRLVMSLKKLYVE